MWGTLCRSWTWAQSNKGLILKLKYTTHWWFLLFKILFAPVVCWLPPHCFSSGGSLVKLMQLSAYLLVTNSIKSKFKSEFCHYKPTVCHLLNIWANFVFSMKPSSSESYRLKGSIPDVFVLSDTLVIYISVVRVYDGLLYQLETINWACLGSVLFLCSYTVCDPA